ncbi:MAG: SRPBCC family protein [Actinomycetota bacterium]|nr:SRPBCC family protein [Actinomycetota bacterium]
MAEFRFAGTWRTTAEPDAVWEVLSDPHQWPDWWDAIERIEATDGWREGEPVRLVFRTPAPLPKLSTDMRATELSDRQLTLEGDGALAGDGRLQVRSHDAGSEIDYDLRLRTTKFWLRPLEPMLRSATRDGDAEALREAGERLAALAGGELVQELAP